MQPQFLQLYDTASLYFRAFFGLPTSLRAGDGQPVNAVRGLLDFMARFITEYRPTHAAACWDNSWRPSWRVELVPSYKAHRVLAGELEVVPDELSPQVPLIRAVLDALGIAVVGADDHEADDVIGTLASTASVPVDVITGDRDLFQLVDDARQVRVLSVVKGVRNHERVTDEVLRQRYGMDGAGYADFATLRGDPSDGLPGVAGIGEKTASRLIADHGDLEGVLAAASAKRLSPALTARLSAGIDYLAGAREVVRVRRDLSLAVTLDDLRLPTAPAKPDVFAELADLLNLGGPADRIVAALALNA
ncbi:MAG: 5'-3' exonuclease [Micropruina sp.]|uniref:5'-3' exonuclease n=1 Tax=Micropruina sp. TaxID=2737536 RepID=UPI0039E4779C